MLAGMDFGQIGLVMSRHDIERRLVTVSYTHLTLPTTPYV